MKASPKGYPTFSPGTKSPSRLILRNGTWYFRMAVPRHSRNFLGGLSEFKISLKTGLLREARIKSGEIAANAYRLLLVIEKGQMVMEKLDKKQLRALVKKFLENGLEFYDQEHLSRTAPLSPEEQASGKIKLENLIQFYQEKLAAGDYHVIDHDWLVAQLQNHGLPVPEKDSVEYRMAVAEFMKATIELSKIQARRIEGDFSDTPLLDDLDQEGLNVQNLEEKAIGNVQEVNVTKISDALQAYIDEKMRSNSWTERSAADFIPKLKFFADFTGDIPLNGLNRDIIRNFKQVVDKLPSRYTMSREYRDISIEEIMALDIPMEKRMSISSLSKYYGTINSFLIWLHLQYDNVDRGLSRILTIKHSQQQVDRLRDVFTSEGLEKIFKSDQ